MIVRTNNPRVPSAVVGARREEGAASTAAPSERHKITGHDRLTVAKPQHDFRDQLSDQASARVVFIGVGGGCVARFIHFPFHGSAR